MIEIDPKDLDQKDGAFICEYSESGVGKTVTTLQTAPDPIYWITFEPRKLQFSINAANRPDLKLKIGMYKSFMGFIEYFNDLSKFDKYRTVFADGLSYMMNISVTSEIKDENLNKDADKPIMDVTKISFADQGEINQAVFRVLKRLGDLVATGKIVIISCLESEKTKYRVGEWDQVAGPELGARQVPNNFPGFFDLIGRLTPHIHNSDKDGNLIPCPYCKSKATGKIYPPIISFESDGNFLAKYTGAGKKRVGVLNWEKILKTME